MLILFAIANIARQLKSCLLLKSSLVYYSLVYSLLSSFKEPNFLKIIFFCFLKKKLQKKTSCKLARNFPCLLSVIMKQTVKRKISSLEDLHSRLVLRMFLTFGNLLFRLIPENFVF